MGWISNNKPFDHLKKNLSALDTLSIAFVLGLGDVGVKLDEFRLGDDKTRTLEIFVKEHVYTDNFSLWQPGSGLLELNANANIIFHIQAIEFVFNSDMVFIQLDELLSCVRISLT